MTNYESVREAIEDLEKFRDSLMSNHDCGIHEHFNNKTFAPHYYYTAVANIDAAINQLQLARLYLARERFG